MLSNKLTWSEGTFGRHLNPNLSSVDKAAQCSVRLKYLVRRSLMGPVGGEPA
jgi:hypothetical protein